MSAFSDASAMYSKNELGKIISLSGEYGFIYSTPTAFMCAIPSKHNDIETEYKIELDKPDTWFIFIASGDMVELFEAIEPLKYVAYERFDGKIRHYRFEKLRRLFDGWKCNG